MTKQITPKQDIYTRVTNRIIADLEQGVRPWIKPWSAGHAAGRITRPLRHNGAPYQGINILLLWSAAVTNDYSAPLWMTYRQARELGAHVRKGEKGEPVVYVSTFAREVEDDNGKAVEEQIPFCKGYTVFNVEQIDGLPAHFHQPAEPVLEPVQRIDHVERFFATTGAAIRHSGNSAFYAATSDHIQLPPFESFRDGESYYATLAHELTHWTKHPFLNGFRLNRHLDNEADREGGFRAVAAFSGRNYTLKPLQSPVFVIKLGFAEATTWHEERKAYPLPIASCSEKRFTIFQISMHLKSPCLHL